MLLTVMAVVGKSSITCDFCQHTILESDAVGIEVGRCDNCREYCSKCDTYLDEVGRSGPCDSCLDEENTVSDVTNHTRADWARNALMSFAEETGLVRSGDAEDLNLVMSDFLCDLLHLCDREDIDLEELLRKAEFNFREEQELEEQ